MILVNESDPFPGVCVTLRVYYKFGSGVSDLKDCGVRGSGNLLSIRRLRQTDHYKQKETGSLSHVYMYIYLF